MSKEIRRNALAEAILSANPPLLFEALGRNYFAAGHLPGAQALPLEELGKLAAELAPQKDKTIVVYCSSETCRNSHQAAEWLIGNGYRDVAVYTGGKRDWIEAGLKLEI